MMVCCFPCRHPSAACAVCFCTVLQLNKRTSGEEGQRPSGQVAVVSECFVGGMQAGLKTGMYYLRTRAAADAIKFTVDQQALQKRKAERAGRTPSADPPSPLKVHHPLHRHAEMSPSLGRFYASWQDFGLSRACIVHWPAIFFSG